MSFSILRGHITFKYWIYRVHNGVVDPSDDKRLPCRFKIRLDGFEWFIYNNVAAYEQLKKTLDQDYSPMSPSSMSNTTDRGSTDGFIHSPKSNESNAKDDDFSLLSNMLPFEMIGSRGAIIIGNQDLPTVFTAYYKEFNGTFFKSYVTSLFNFFFPYD